MMAGGAILISLVFFATQVPIDTQWIYLIGFVSMTAALVLLARTELENPTARTAALFAALGWLILVVATIVPALPGLVASSAYLVIAAASIVTAAVVYARRQLTDRARIALVSLLAVTALYMGSAILAIYGPFAALLTLLLGIAAVPTGYFIQTRR